MFLHYSPFWLKAIFSKYLWHVPTQEKKLYLTFDDGPIPDITENVLDTLAQYGAKATFFCIGDNVHKHPAVYQKVLAAGHSVGNHTFNHLNGWKTEDTIYLSNIDQCTQQLDLSTRLFRPPYGRIKGSQARVVMANKQVVMWDVLSGDFSKEISPETCLRQSIKHTRPGSILLFHDSIKAAPNMQYVVPRVLQHFTEAGFTFEALPMH